MWMVAVVTVLVSHSLFPDETDYRVLMPLPVDRRLIFGSKLLALALFAGLFTGTTHLAIAPLVLLISAGRWAADPMPLAVLGFFAVSIPASLCALLAVVAVIGAVISCIPRRQVLARRRDPQPDARRAGSGAADDWRCRRRLRRWAGTRGRCSWRRRHGSWAPAACSSVTTTRKLVDLARIAAERSFSRRSLPPAATSSCIGGSISDAALVRHVAGATAMAR